MEFDNINTPRDETTEAILSAIPDIMFLLDSEGRFIDYHTEYPEQLYVEKEKFIDKFIDEVMPLEISEKAKKFIKIVLETKERHQFSYELKIQDSIRYYEARIVPCFKNTVLTIIRDITENIRIKKNQTLLNEILFILNSNMEFKEIIDNILILIKKEMDLSAVGIRFKNNNDYPYFSQSGFTDEFILAENSLVSKNFENDICRDKNGNPSLECTCGAIISGKYKDSSLLTKHGSLYTNNSFSFLDLDPKEDIRYKPRNNYIHRGYGSVALIPIWNDKEVIGLLQLNNKKTDSFDEKMIEFLEGITLNIGISLSRKKFQEELMKSKEKAEQSDKMKLEFIANMSHDLRTPMNSIIGFSDLLRSNNLTKHDKQDYINTIINNGKFLMTLIDDIIDISKIDSQSLKIENKPFELNKLLDELRLSYTKQVRDKKIDIIIDMDINKNIIINSDKYRIRQVLMNLIGNAIKFTNNGYVKFGYKIFNNKHLELYVEDSGIGIKKENQEIIFERFKQLNESTNKFKGAGLGLSITKSLVDLLGFGNVKLQSEFGKGSKFYFQVPYDIKHFNYITDIKTKKHKKIDFTGKTILVVEDDMDSVKIIKSYLSYTNVNIIEALNGNDVMNIIHSNKVDLVLLDIGLPGKNGYEVLGEIRQYNDRLPVIIESALAMPDQKDKAYELGCDEFLTKPYNKEEFLNKIDKLL